MLVEVGDALAAPESRFLASQLIRRVQSDPAIDLMPVTHDLFEHGLELYESRPDKRWSLTDSISMSAMHERGLTDVLTGDRHFEQGGFRALLTA